VKVPMVIRRAPLSAPQEEFVGACRGLST